MKWFQFLFPVVFTLIYCGFVKSELFVACRSDDTPCINLSTQLFLTATAKGVPEYGLLAIDPLTIPELELRPDDQSIDLVYTLTDTVVTGLKYQDVTDFKYDRNTFIARLQLRAPTLMVEGNIKIALASNRGISVSGKYSGNGGVSLTVSYPAGPLQKFPDGTEHFVIGSETTECTSIGQPIYKLDDKLVQELDNVKEIQQERAKIQDSNSKNIPQEVMCKLAKLAYVSVIHNTREIAKKLPKNSFMTDV